MTAAGMAEVVRPAAAIVALARLGWRLFPCRRRDKRPRIKGWQDAATSDPAQLVRWARAFPGCNWGVATGAVSGIWVLDIDGPSGRDAFHALLERAVPFAPLPGAAYRWRRLAAVPGLAGGPHRPQLRGHGGAER